MRKPNPNWHNPRCFERLDGILELYVDSDSLGRYAWCVRPLVFMNDPARGGGWEWNYIARGTCNSKDEAMLAAEDAAVAYAEGLVVEARRYADQIISEIRPGGESD